MTQGQRVALFPARNRSLQFGRGCPGREMVPDLIWREKFGGKKIVHDFLVQRARPLEHVFLGYQAPFPRVSTVQDPAPWCTCIWEGSRPQSEPGKKPQHALGRRQGPFLCAEPEFIPNCICNDTWHVAPSGCSSHSFTALRLSLCTDVNTCVLCTYVWLHSGGSLKSNSYNFIKEFL